MRRKGIFFFSYYFKTRCSKEFNEVLSEKKLITEYRKYKSLLLIKVSLILKNKPKNNDTGNTHIICCLLNEAVSSFEYIMLSITHWRPRKDTGKGKGKAVPLQA